MPFLGNQPAEGYRSIAKQTITGDGSTTYVLNNKVTSANDIEVFVNNVRQEPGVAYTATGNSITFADAITSGDSCYIVYQGRAVTSNLIESQNIASGAIGASAIASGAVEVGALASGAVEAAIITPFTFRNKIINGDMRIAQRGSSAITSNGYPVDRFQVISNTSDFTAIKTSTVPTGQNFTTSVSIQPTATKTPGAGTYAAIITNVEGYNCTDLRWGTSSAKPITVSFWVRSSKIGNYCWSTKNADASRSYSTTYTINSADTWEFKTFTVPGDTSGTWSISNTRGITCDFWLAGNNTQVNVKDQWYGGNINMNNDQVNFFDSTSNIFYITGVQLELGSVATEFEHRPYNIELHLCERYFQNLGNVNFMAWNHNIADTGGTRIQTVTLATPMRTDPSFSYDDNAGNSNRLRAEYPNSTSGTNISFSFQGGNRFITGFKYPYGELYGSNGSVTGILTAFNLKLSAEL